MQNPDTSERDSVYVMLSQEYKVYININYIDINKLM